jgi:hypothetical protein
MMSRRRVLRDEDQRDRTKSGILNIVDRGGMTVLRLKLSLKILEF